MSKEKTKDKFLILYVMTIIIAISTIVISIAFFINIINDKNNTHRNDLMKKQITNINKTLMDLKKEIKELNDKNVIRNDNLIESFKLDLQDFMKTEFPLLKDK